MKVPIQNIMALHVLFPCREDSALGIFKVMETRCSCHKDLVEVRRRQTELVQTYPEAGIGWFYLAAVRLIGGHAQMRMSTWKCVHVFIPESRWGFKAFNRLFTTWGIFHHSTLCPSGLEVFFIFCSLSFTAHFTNYLYASKTACKLSVILTNTLRQG